MGYLCVSVFPLFHHLNHQSDFKRISYERYYVRSHPNIVLLTVKDMKMANVQTCEKTAALVPSSSIRSP